jgi:hypothetical protein
VGAAMFQVVLVAFVLSCLIALIGYGRPPNVRARRQRLWRARMRAVDARERERRLKWWR